MVFLSLKVASESQQGYRQFRQQEKNDYFRCVNAQYSASQLAKMNKQEKAKLEK